MASHKEDDRQERQVEWQRKRDDYVNLVILGALGVLAVSFGNRR
jgi:hypothetical protein